MMLQQLQSIVKSLVVIFSVCVWGIHNRCSVTGSQWSHLGMHERTTKRRTAACMTNYGRGSSCLWSSYALDLARPESPHTSIPQREPHTVLHITLLLSPPASLLNPSKCSRSLQILLQNVIHMFVCTATPSCYLWLQTARDSSGSARDISATACNTIL